MDLTQLPPPSVVETLDFETILAERKATLISYYPADQQAAIAATLELESEPLNKLLQENAYREVILRARINDAAKQTLLAFASGTNLDHIAAEYNITRLLATPGDPTANPPIAPVYESDDRLRMRCQMAFEGLNTAGSINSYKFHALSASVEVADVAIYSPVPDGTVRVTILSPEGQPSASTLNLVERALSAEDVRPLCDLVAVEPAQIKPYAVDATLNAIGLGKEQALAAANEAMTNTAAAYYRVGATVPLSAIYAALHQPGIDSVTLRSPLADVTCSPQQAAKLTSINLD
ncbi:baseplate J/gp47 family protein [Aeromonas salmonicida]|uniref:baseplate assembly protein n=1 Tax=Aeromonas salmonicida TaxID=645 RepID=UPI00259DCF5A|nr:baseplate J/gp47 family protein [Aeromonas salmonicida]MDM5065986.1 baseplate J/gp47 family protein [Aeromonas salmonicida]